MCNFFIIQNNKDEVKPQDFIQLISTNITLYIVILSIFLTEFWHFRKRKIEKMNFSMKPFFSLSIFCLSFSFQVYKPFTHGMTTVCFNVSFAVIEKEGWCTLYVTTKFLIVAIVCTNENYEVKTSKIVKQNCIEYASYFSWKLFKDVYRID